MRMVTFARRTAAEILRDPLNLFFGLGFPLVLLLLMTAIQANIPVELFTLPVLAPAVAAFGLSFMTLFSANLIARDRETAFLQRLYTTPLTSADYLLGYTLPLLPMALAQSAVCYGAAMLLGLPVTAHILSALVGSIPVALFFIALGLLCGSVFNVKQVGGLCGALLTNLTAFLSGAWFDLKLVGGVFERVANMLPFVHAVELERALLRGEWAAALPHFVWVAGYGIAILAAGMALFVRAASRR